MTTIYLIRHGQTDNNIHGGFNGCVCDQPLNETGREMAARLTPIFADVHLDAIYASPLVRAVQTAEAVRGGRELPLHLEPRLRETDFGLLDGLDWPEAQKRYPRECHAWLHHPATFRAPGAAESVRDMWTRVYCAFLQILRENRGKTVAVVAHGMVFTVLTARLLGLDLSRYRRMPMLSNAAYRVLKIEDDGHLFIDKWEYNAHLKPEWLLRARHLRKRTKMERRIIPRRAFCAALKLKKREVERYGD